MCAEIVASELEAIIELFFLRDNGKSIRCLQRLLGIRKFFQVRTFKDSINRRWHKLLTSQGSDRKAHLREFSLYRPHLAYLHQQMLGWKPRSFFELFIPGYADRLGWYTAIFA